MFSLTRTREIRHPSAIRRAVESLEQRVLLAYTLDPSFSGDGIAEGIGTGQFAVQSDNKVVALVDFNQPTIGRLLTDGSFDPTFGTGGKATTPFPVSELLISNGKIIVASPDFRLARLNSNGTLDTTFGGGDGIATVPTQYGASTYDLALAPDGKLVLVGSGYYSPDMSDSSQDRSYHEIARFNPDGTLDTSFRGTGFSETVVNDWHFGALEVAGVQSDGKIILLGTSAFSVMDGMDWDMDRLNVDGSGDSTFQGSGWKYDAVSSLEIQSDNKILLVRDGKLQRYNANGTVDTTFNINGLGTDSVVATSVLPNGKILVTGSTGFVARLLPNGNLDSTFTTGGRLFLSSMGVGAVHPDSQNRVIIGGGVVTSGRNKAEVARLADLPQSPFKGSPFQVGRTIQAEDFDIGGEGVAYHDSDSKNRSGYYRTGESVDIQRTGDAGGGYDVNRVNPGEWLEYTINVPAAGEYTIDTRVASGKSGGSFHYEIDGRRTRDVPIPNTGAYQTYQTVTNSLGNLTPGIHILRLMINPSPLSGPVANFNWMMLKSTGAFTTSGLKADYFDNMDFTARVRTFPDADIDEHWSTDSPGPDIEPDTFSVRWTGKIEVPATGRYTFYTDTDDGVRLWVNNQLLIDHLSSQGETEWSGAINLVAGPKYDFRMDYVERYSNARAILRWSGPGIAQQVVPASAFSHTTISDDIDPPFPVDNFRSTRASSNAIDLAWDGATDNIGVTGYELFIDDAHPVTLGGSARAYTFNNLQPNTSHKFTIDAIDAAGNQGLARWIFVTTAQSALTSGRGQSPFKGSPFNVGNPIQAEDYDLGGEGVAYHDNDALNKGGAYRRAEGVDIQPTTDTGGGYNVGRTDPGEWMEYTIKVPTAGRYSIATRLASPKAGNFQYEIDGIDATGNIAIPATGAYKNWTTITNNLGSLAAGVHILRLVNGTGAVNFNWLKITRPKHHHRRHHAPPHNSAMA